MAPLPTYPDSARESFPPSILSSRNEYVVRYAYIAEVQPVTRSRLSMLAVRSLNESSHGVPQCHVRQGRMLQPWLVIRCVVPRPDRDVGRRY